MTSPAPDATPTSEPVLIAHAVTVILAALVSLGWIAVPNDTIDLAGSIVAMVISTAVAVVARSRVTPLAKAGVVDVTAVRLMVADAVRAELATLAAYRSAVDTSPPAQAVSQPGYTFTTSSPANVRTDWMGRPQ